MTLIGQAVYYFTEFNYFVVIVVLYQYIILRTYSYFPHEYCTIQYTQISILDIGLLLKLECRDFNSVFIEIQML